MMNPSCEEATQHGNNSPECLCMRLHSATQLIDGNDHCIVYLHSARESLFSPHNVSLASEIFTFPEEAYTSKERLVYTATKRILPQFRSGNRLGPFNY